MSEIVIYKNSENSPVIEISYQNDSFWLSLNQIADLFQRNKSVISRHIKNLFKDGELEQNLVVAKKATTAKDGKQYQIEFYNLDVIISIGYRVNSIKGTQFRIWATHRLKEYLVQGYAINQKRLNELDKTVKLIQHSGKVKNLQLQEAQGLLEILSNYTQSFVLLNRYDSNNLQTNNLNENVSYAIKYEEAKLAIDQIKRKLFEKKEASELFGNEKDNSFQSSLQNIVQTFDGQYLYPSIEEQAANLLYFVIKNATHSRYSMIQKLNTDNGLQGRWASTPALKIGNCRTTFSKTIKINFAKKTNTIEAF